MSLFPLHLFHRIKCLQLDTLDHAILRAINFLVLSMAIFVFLMSSYPGCAYFLVLHIRLFLVIDCIFKRLFLILIDWIKFISVTLRLDNGVNFLFLILIKLRKLLVVASILFNPKISLEFRSLFLSSLA